MLFHTIPSRLNNTVRDEGFALLESGAVETNGSRNTEVKTLPHTVLLRRKTPCETINS